MTFTSPFTSLCERCQDEPWGPKGRQAFGLETQLVTGKTISNTKCCNEGDEDGRHVPLSYRWETSQDVVLSASSIDTLQGGLPLIGFHGL